MKKKNIKRVRNTSKCDIIYRNRCAKPLSGCSVSGSLSGRAGGGACSPGSCGGGSPAPGGSAPPSAGAPPSSPHHAQPSNHQVRAPTVTTTRGFYSCIPSVCRVTFALALWLLYKKSILQKLKFILENFPIVIMLDR